MSRPGEDATDRGAGVPARRVALRALRRAHRDDAWGSPALDAALGEAQLDARDRAFATALALDTLRREGTLDWALGQVLDRSIDDIEPDVRDVLRLGAWQIGYGRVPTRAAVSTSVELAREEVGARATGFVNGVLRALGRRWDELPWPDPSEPEGLALATGYPRWVVEAAVARFGAGARSVLEAGNAPPGATLRARPGARDALVAELRDAGLSAEPGRLHELAVRVPGADPRRLAATREGRAVTQDEASMLVVDALDARLDPHSRVLEPCAAPGGKASDLVLRGHRVVAADRHAGRVREMADLVGRLGIDLDLAVADGTTSPWRDGAFDAVLVDAPCTGLGTVRRRPELRWRRDPGDPGTLAELQRALLAAAVRSVPSGGTVCYSVCTWTAAETDEVVAWALAHLPVRLVPADGPPDAEAAHAGAVQLRPDEHDSDGMYYAVLRRE
ncbi:transcription antitermination factor NusB [Egibacter rhizosphaerae]|uniref:transcription antitermination factor NusB n=1 Tax=Egibacter rhizosphaerae TaxID=1670831 RepID=UPI0013F15D5D|nr:transcription antitermination factor NusB [Egibacter rhizosphaerae]